MLGLVVVVLSSLMAMHAPSSDGAQNGRDEIDAMDAMARSAEPAAPIGRDAHRDSPMGAMAHVVQLCLATLTVGVASAWLVRRLVGALGGPGAGLRAEAARRVRTAVLPWSNAPPPGFVVLRC